MRVLNSIVDRLDVSQVLASYKGGGNSCFHPRMMLKVLLYAYLNNIYSSRKIERQLQEHIHYMWLSGGARPDFRTINYFRGKRLKDSFDAIFTRVVELLHSEGFVSLEVQYIDGTKIESVANKYTFVWRGSIETYDTRLREKTRRILSEAEEVLEMESHETRPDEELSVEEFQARTSRIKEKMNSTDVPKKIKKAVEKTAKEYIPKMLEYERALDIMGKRNSYSKTDEDATFMRMKEDAMKKQQATMELYKKAGINPMGGCIPMLIQMPILIAMFRFFPASIELREQPFLWADDLSSYDSIVNLPFSIPFYGDHVSLFALLMAVSLFGYSYFNYQQTASSQPQMAGMKFMMVYMMPIMMLLWFNSYSSGLCYYYLLSNLFTIGQTLLIRRMVDDDKIHAVMQANAAKRSKGKKSKFQQRYEELLRQQEAQQRTKRK